jgi:hypothetical protein
MVRTTMPTREPAIETIASIAYLSLSLVEGFGFAFCCWGFFDLVALLVALAVFFAFEINSPSGTDRKRGG